MSIRKLLTYTVLVTFIWLVLPFLTFAQQPAYYKEIQEFKKQDSAHPPTQHAILFAGSSSFTKWTDVQDYFPGYKILNRGFGGSSLPDLVNYAEDIIFPYQPKQLVIYCGENDLAASDAVTAKMVINRFKSLFLLIRERMPGLPIVFVSLKPSPSRERLRPKMEEVNREISGFLKTKTRTAFVDVYKLMLNSDGSVKSDLFIEDNLHMNAKGYAIWKDAIKPYLLKD